MAALLGGLLLAHTTPRLTIFVLAAPVVVAAIIGTLSPAIRDLPSLAEASPAAAG